MPSRAWGAGYSYLKDGLREVAGRTRWGHGEQLPFFKGWALDRNWGCSTCGLLLDALAVGVAKHDFLPFTPSKAHATSSLWQEEPCHNDLCLCTLEITLLSVVYTIQRIVLAYREATYLLCWISDLEYIAFVLWNCTGLKEVSEWNWKLSLR